MKLKGITAELLIDLATQEGFTTMHYKSTVRTLHRL